MNIQSLGSPVTPPKPDDRPTPPADAVAAQPAQPRPADAAPPTREQVTAAVKQINQSLPASASLEFSIDDDSKQTIVKIVDLTTKEVLRQIPTTEALEIAKSFDKMMGRLISQKA
jgi:flagellar protein FlaG